MGVLLLLIYFYPASHLHRETVHCGARVRYGGAYQVHWFPQLCRPYISHPRSEQLEPDSAGRKANRGRCVARPQTHVCKLLYGTYIQS
jgi:hypothetical protein